MPRYPIPRDEAERLVKLHEYAILDSMAEEAFDRLTRLASRLLDVPIALISLVDENRQWFKSRIGLDASQTSREISFCAHAICKNEVMMVEDATKDERFWQSPLVTGAPSIRFYAGAPLRTNAGLNMGTLCVIDTEKRNLTREQTTLLADLAAIVVDQMEICQLAKQAKQAEEQLMDAMDSLPDGFVLYDQEDRLVFCNKRYLEIYNQSADLIVPGATFGEIIRKGVERGQYPDAIGNEEAWINERLEIHSNPGEPIEQQLPGDEWLRIQEGRTREGGLVGFRFDITELKRQRRELHRLAWTDSLTGALNRHRFVDLAENELQRAKRHNTDTCMLLIDVDHFKQINDRYGHGAGDVVLTKLVEHWKRELRNHDILGRIGGEEFCIILPQVNAKDAMEAAERIRASTEMLPIAVEGQLLNVTVSVGLADYQQESDSVKTMMDRADKALYEAKECGRNRLVLRAA